MRTVYVVAKSKREVDQLMTPFNLESVVPSYVDINEFLRTELMRTLEQYDVILEEYKSLKKFKDDNRHNPCFVNHVINQLPTFTDENPNAKEAFWNYLCEQYGIQDEDILPNGTFIRRFNTNGKWDFYELKSERIKVKEFKKHMVNLQFDILLPNYLWIDHNDQKFSTDDRYQRIIKYEDYYIYKVSYFA